METIYFIGGIAILVALFVLAVFRRSLFRLTWAWDDSNLILPSLYHSARKRPNLHFRWGYPDFYPRLINLLSGGHWISYFKLTRVIALVSIALLSAICWALSFLVLFPGNSTVAILASVCVPVLSWGRWVSANHGHLAELLEFSAVALVLFAFYGETSPLVSQEELFGSYLLFPVLSGTLLGVAILLKQTAIISLAFTGFATILFVASHLFLPDSWITHVVVAAIASLPVLAIPLGRLSAQGHRMLGNKTAYPALTLVFLIPFLAYLLVRTASASPYANQICIGAVAFCAASCLVLFLYLLQLGPKQASFFLHETLRIVPKLIDRDFPQDFRLHEELQTALIVGFVFGTASLFADTAISSAVVGSFTLISVVGFLVIYRLLAKDRPAAFSVEMYLTATGILLLITSMYSLTGLSMWSPAQLLFLTYGLVVASRLPPYAGNVMYSSSFLVPTAALMMHGAVSSDPSIPAAIATALTTLPLLVLFLLGTSDIVQQQKSAALSPLSDGLTAPAESFETLLFEASTVIRDRFPDAKSIWGYPNMALLYAFTDLEPWGFFPNFLGSPDELQKTLRQLQEDGPDLIIVNRLNSPYPTDHPYFPLFDQSMLELLLAHYDTDVSMSCSPESGPFFDIYVRRAEAR